MTTVVTSVLEKGRGPRELCSALSASVRPLGELLRSLGALKTVRAELPRNVLGGDLLGLLSNRMRAMLESDDQRPDGVNVERTSNPRFTDRSELTGSTAAPFSSDREPGSAQASGFAAIEARLQRRGSKPAPPDSRDAHSRSDPFSPRGFLAAPQQEWETTRA